MMQHTREDVLGVVVQLVQRLSADWEDGGDVGEGTRLLGNMNWRSLDVVVLANDLQDHYGRAFPFSELFAEIGKREERDILIGELTDFVWEHLERSRVPGGAN
jgi:hypothetical protein